MNCISLLSSTVRLLDLHDSDRGRGENPQFQRESRPGKSDGFYLDVALDILEFLKEMDDLVYQDVVPFTAIHEHVNKTWPNIDQNDVHYVLNVLKRPTELYYLTSHSEQGDKILQSEKKRTSLVEKTDYTDEYRLSQTGRTFPILANAAQDAIYIKGDAYNLLKAVEIGDFNKVKTFAEDIIWQLRNEILDVRSALEKVGRTETIDKYFKNFQNYIKTVEETKKIILDVEENLDTLKTLEAFNDWQDRTNTDFTFDGLTSNIIRIRQVIVTYSRLISDLIKLASEDKRSAVHPPSFKEFAFSIVQNPLSDKMENFFLQQWGSVQLETPFYSFLDGLDAVKIRIQPKSNEPVDFGWDEIEPISRLGKMMFLDKHGRELSEMLSNGTVKLSDAIDRGFFIVDELFMLGDLVGVFVAPDSLNVNKKIEIRVSPSLSICDVDGGDFLFTDLELALKEDK